MARRLWSVVVLVALLAGQACDQRGLSSTSATTTENARTVMMLRVRLGEGFQNNTVSVRVDGKDVYHRAGVSTDWTISRADVVDVQTGAPSVRLEVLVENGPQLAWDITPAHTPFVEVSLVNGVLQLGPLDQDPPVL